MLPTLCEPSATTGVYCEDKPFSAQFHPESTLGPCDPEFLFGVFIQNIANCVSTDSLVLISLPSGKKTNNDACIPCANVQQVLILGSGGLSISQAGEFDYSSSQVIKALKEEGIYTILLNPNIATIATSKGLAHKVYFLPVTPEFVRKIIQCEKPDGIYVPFRGQTALNVGIKLMQVLGTPIETIIATEDRQIFTAAMEQIDGKCAQSASATMTDEAIVAAVSSYRAHRVCARRARLGLCAERGAAQGAVQQGFCDESPGAGGEEHEGAEGDRVRGRHGL